MSRIQICSVAPKRYNPEGFRIRRSYNWGTLFIPGCEEGQEYVSLFVEEHTDNMVQHVEYDAAKAIITPIVIPAETIVKDFFANEQLAQKGGFIPAGEIPTAQELAQARANRKAYLVRLIQEGDIEWGRSGSVVNISGEAKRAVEELGVDNDWAKLAPKESMECPACGDRIKPNVAICKSCGAILDRAKAEKFGLIESGNDEPAKRGPGRPRKEAPEQVEVT